MDQFQRIAPEILRVQVYRAASTILSKNDAAKLGELYKKTAEKLAAFLQREGFPAKEALILAIRLVDNPTDIRFRSLFEDRKRDARDIRGAVEYRFIEPFEEKVEMTIGSAKIVNEFEEMRDVLKNPKRTPSEKKEVLIQLIYGRIHEIAADRAYRAYLVSNARKGARKIGLEVVETKNWEKNKGRIPNRKSDATQRVLRDARKARLKVIPKRKRRP